MCEFVIRIARVVRLVRFSPGLRTIVTALLRSLPGVGGFLALALVTFSVYGMEEARRLEMTEQRGTDADGDGVPDEIERIMISQRLDDLRGMIGELERELRIDRDAPARSSGRQL